jgi:hypothetical protein
MTDKNMPMGFFVVHFSVMFFGKHAGAPPGEVIPESMTAALFALVAIAGKIFL